MTDFPRPVQTHAHSCTHTSADSSWSFKGAMVQLPVCLGCSPTGSAARRSRIELSNFTDSPISPLVSHRSGSNLHTVLFVTPSIVLTLNHGCRTFIKHVNAKIKEDIRPFVYIFGGCQVIVKSVIRNSKQQQTMSIFLKTAESTESPCPDQLHFLPARLNKDSAADVEKYFDQFTEETSSGCELLSNSLRGRPVVGAKIQVPEGWQGVVYTERKRPLSDEVDRTFHQKATFDKFTYWNYDKNPTKNDAFAQALQWLEISDFLHAPEKLSTN